MIENEKKELDLLLNNGELISIGDGQLKIQRMNLGRILKISRVAIELDAKEGEMKDADLSQLSAVQFNSVIENAKKCAQIIATATTPNYKDDTEIGMQTAEIMDEMTSVELLAGAMKIVKTADFANFTTSTFLMNGNRITQATKVEE